MRYRIEHAAEKVNDGYMRRLLVPALSALLLAVLAACESTSASVARDIALDAPQRCMHCGWIESKREIQQGVADPYAPVIYEYTVRMADGSHSVFREQLSVRWRVGERLIFIAGAGAAD